MKRTIRTSNFYATTNKYLLENLVDILLANGFLPTVQHYISRHTQCFLRIKNIKISF
jgi:hypothetical protein